MVGVKGLTEGLRIVLFHVGTGYSSYARLCVQRVVEVVSFSLWEVFDDGNRKVDSGNWISGDIESLYEWFGVWGRGLAPSRNLRCP